MSINETFILNLQQAPNVDESFSIFLKKIREIFPIENAVLAFKAGILYKRVDFRENTFTSQALHQYHFLESKEDFFYTLSEKTLMLAYQAHTYIVQVKLEFSQAEKEEKLLPKVLPAARIFLNHVLLLLRLENLEFHSIKDDITLAYNQKYLRAWLHNEIERSKRYNTIFSLVFFDLDNLKAINEIHGHLIGTEVLKAVATVLRQQVRATDLLSRFGGDEFVIVLLQSEPENAAFICERIKAAMEATRLTISDKLELKMTGCFGISSFPRDGGTVEELIEKADAAMYDVKHSGKNGIKIYQGDEQ